MSQHPKSEVRPLISRRFLLDLYQHLRKAFGPRHWWPGESRLEIVVGAILTQNTSWASVERAIRNLEKARLLVSSRLYSIPQKRLAELIRPVGYFRLKARRLKHFIRYFVRGYQGSFNRMFRKDPRKLREELLQIWGIGEETADSILLYAGKKPFFVVDAYTRRIFSRHHLINENTSYNELRQWFEKRLPPDHTLYNDFHAQLVECAKVYCRTIPRCESCPLAYLFELENKLPKGAESV